MVPPSHQYSGYTNDVANWLNLATTDSVVTSFAFSEEQVCSQKFLRDFAAACRKMSPLVEFTTRALGLKY
jgi:hypothetical protein